MRLRTTLIVIFCLAAGARCATASDEAPGIDRYGVVHYTASHVSQIVTCGRHRIALQGSHTKMDLRGACWSVVLTGSHNDIRVEMARNGRFYITGSHNDVTWLQVQRGRPPYMLDRGDSNTFHPTPTAYPYH